MFASWPRSKSVLLVPPDRSAFSGMAQPGTAVLDASDFAILPRAISAQRCLVRCNGLFGGGSRQTTARGVGAGWSSLNESVLRDALKAGRICAGFAR